MATDNFTTDVSPLGSPWEKTGNNMGAFAASGGVAVPSSGNSAMHYSASSVAYSAVKIATVGDLGCGPTVRAAADTTIYPRGYLGQASTATTVDIYLMHSSGTFTKLGSTQTVPTVQAGDVLSLEHDGSNLLTLKINGSTVHSHTDSTWTDGSPGMWSYSSTPRLDDWTDEASAGPSVSIAALAAGSNVFIS